MSESVGICNKTIQLLLAIASLPGSNAVSKVAIELPLVCVCNNAPAVTHSRLTTHPQPFIHHSTTTNTALNTNRLSLQRTTCPLLASGHRPTDHHTCIANLNLAAKPLLPHRSPSSDTQIPEPLRLPVLHSPCSSQQTCQLHICYIDYIDYTISVRVIHWCSGYCLPLCCCSSLPLPVSLLLPTAHPISDYPLPHKLGHY